MDTLNKEMVEKFYIESLLVDPIKDIIKKLQSNSFRDCDIKWLDSKLKAYADLACKIMGKRITAPTSSGCSIMNEYAKSKYMGRFSTLLNFFEVMA